VNEQNLLQFFNRFPPLTDDGRMRYLDLLKKSGNPVKFSAQLKEYWAKGYFDSTKQDMIMARWDNALTAEDHAKRLDTLLWQGNLPRAENTLPLVSNTARVAGKARIALQRSRSDVIPEADELTHDDNASPGLYFDLVRFYRQRDQDEQAIAVLSRFRGDMDPYAAQWWRQRSILARDEMDQGNFKRAYALSSAHQQTEPVALSDAEFFSGWLAATRLNQPMTAFKHFERMYHNVTSPISVARAAYWAGFAASQARQPQLAVVWYKLAAKHMNTFYGQMAAYALNDPAKYYADFFKRSHGAPPPDHLRSDLIDAARELHRRNMEKERDEFLQAALDDAKEKNIPQNLIRVARELNSPRMALLAAKAAYDSNYLVVDALFPVINVPEYPGVEKALALGIIRQESQFDRLAVSPANARGLMQLMPATASHTARQCGVGYRGTAELFQPTANMTLGQAYLGSLLARYNNFVPLAAAAYNAGPHNVDNWLSTMGDPRADPRTWVDWSERIPFYETRNYVQRVWESYQIYTQRVH
jgi:soluble lytic murein transglycosylase